MGRATDRVFTRVLCQRLRAACAKAPPRGGFRQRDRDGEGDEGIHGVAVYILTLVSFPVYFQRKRYRVSARAGTAKDFRGAMAGRGEKGLLITTGSSTKDAHAEATRDGAPPVRADRRGHLGEQRKQYGLAVEVKQHSKEDVVVHDAFFREFR